MAKNKKGPEIRFQLLFWPATDGGFETDLYHKYVSVPSLTRNMMIWFWNEYLADDENKNDFYAAPLKASVEQLTGLPPAMLQVPEIDVLNDEGKAYAKKLDEAGVAVTLMELGGMIHDYGLLNPLCTVPAVQRALRATATGLRNALK